MVCVLTVDEPSVSVINVTPLALTELADTLEPPVIENAISLNRSANDWAW